MKFDPNAAPPCPECGGVYVVTEWPDEEGSLWSAACACGVEWLDLSEPPSWRMLAKENRQVAALVALLEGS